MLIVSSLVLSQATTAMAEIIPAGVKPKAENDVRLIVYNDSSYTLRVTEGDLVQTDVILPPKEKLNLYMYGRIYSLQIYYKEDGKWKAANSCPSGTYYSTVNTVARDSYWLQHPVCSSAKEMSPELKAKFNSAPKA